MSDPVVPEPSRALEETTPEPLAIEAIKLITDVAASHAAAETVKWLSAKSEAPDETASLRGAITEEDDESGMRSEEALGSAFRSFILSGRGIAPRRGSETVLHGHEPWAPPG